MTRATFDRLSGFGAFRELGQEDIDFSLQAWRTGIDVLAVPSARLAHRFRPNPPYRLSSLSRAYNVARIALVHSMVPVVRNACAESLVHPEPPKSWSMRSIVIGKSKEAL